MEAWVLAIANVNIIIRIALGNNAALKAMRRQESLIVGILLQKQKKSSAF